MEYTVLRVKRRIDCNPVDSLVVNYKKAKVDESSLSQTQRAAFVKTVGSVKDDDALLTELLSKDFSKDLKHHSIPVDHDSAETCPKRIKLIDLNEQFKIIPAIAAEGSVTCNDQPMDCAYVYDLYVWKSTRQDHELLEDLSAFPSDLRDGASSDNEQLDDTSDSNSESNWRNDYPEEDEFAESDDGRECGGFGEEESSTDEKDANKEDSDSADDSDDAEKLSEFQQIKKKYSKILKMMRQEGHTFNSDDLFK